MRENNYHLVKGSDAYFIKAHQERGRTTPLTTKQGQTSKKQTTFIGNGKVDAERQTEAMCFLLLNGPTFGDQKPSNG
jgi:hypothetical protein